MSDPQRPVARRWAGAGLLAATAIAAGAVPTGGAVAQETHLARLAKLGTELARQLSDGQEQALSGGGLRLIEISKHFSRFDFRALTRERAAAQAAVRPSAPAVLPPGQVSDPFAAEDFASRLSGMTQSETSAAWCGGTAAIGFNDSGSFAATAFLGVNPNDSLAFQGWARSTDAGRTFRDRGALFARSLPTGVRFRDLLGDPVLGCTSSSTYYFASLAIDVPVAGTPVSGIAVSRSTDGALSFPRTVLAAGKTVEGHFLDKPWMAVQPGPTAAADDDVVHVTYTDFDFSGRSGLCGPDRGRIAIDYVRSRDGGRTWTSPTALAQVCDPQVLQGSQVEVGPGDDVHVAWQAFATFPAPSEIRTRRSADQGSSWALPRVVDRVGAVGDGFFLQGGFRAFIGLQGLAVDTSATPTRGTLYVTWHDGRFRSQPDPLGNCDGATYCFGDALISRSTDGGSTWSGAVRINDDDPLRGVDQVFPALDVDRSGTVWVGFYDRRFDTRNLLLDMVVARSGDRGATWQNTRATARSFPPITGWQDAVVNPAYMGDYLAVAADRLATTPGVVTAWGDNSRGDANVLGRRF